jgi:hypothetical protein
MDLDTYIGFGGVALFGLIAFCAAWFSTPKRAGKHVGRR